MSHPPQLGHLDARSVLTARLLDDAAIFPPGNAQMAAALTAHRRARIGNHAALIGPFVCSIARLRELADLLAAENRRVDRSVAAVAQLEVAVVVPQGSGDLAPALEHAFPDGGPMSLAALEIALSLEEVRDGNRLGLLAKIAERSGAGGRPIAVFVEPAALPVRARDLADLTALGLAAKFRTGGLTASAFPDQVALGRAICSAVEAGVAFKCTAGLHRAVRARGEDGLEHHGFCNVLVATQRALAGAECEFVIDALDVREASDLRDELCTLETEETVALRGAFSSFGTCSTDEPIADLERLGLLP